MTQAWTDELDEFEWSEADAIDKMFHAAKEASIVSFSAPGDGWMPSLTLGEAPLPYQFDFRIGDEIIGVGLLDLRRDFSLILRITAFDLTDLQKASIGSAAINPVTPLVRCVVLIDPRSGEWINKEGLFHLTFQEGAIERLAEAFVSIERASEVH